MLTLVIFSPLLLDLGAKTRPPDVAGPFADWWLLALAVGTAALHMGGAFWIGRPLVVLEVNNQRVEAAFRRRLVLDESMPAGAECEDLEAPMWSLTEELRRNYMSLYRSFFLMNSYLGAFDQVMIILPYLAVAPLLFAPADERVKLGVLVQVSNAFGRVFGALTVVAESWADVQDFRSTLHRLREFERAFARKPLPTSSLIPATMELRSDVVHAEVAHQEEYTDPVSKGA